MAPGTCSISESRAGGCLLRAVSGSARFGSNSTHDPTPVTIAGRSEDRRAITGRGGASGLVPRLQLPRRD
jgi:hypothetical protein